MASFFMLKFSFCTIINILEGKFGDDIAYNMQFYIRSRSLIACSVDAGWVCSGSLTDQKEVISPK